MVGGGSGEVVENCLPNGGGYDWLGANDFLGGLEACCFGFDPRRHPFSADITGRSAGSGG